MSFTNINYNENHYKLIWTSGELEGFYIDFKYQEIGYRENGPERIEFRKLQIIKYLLEHSTEYITGTQINLTEELNSIDLPKSISSIKASILKALNPVFDKDKASDLYNLIIDKHRINGQMGYKLLTSDAVLSNVDEAENHQIVASIDTYADKSDNSYAEESFSYIQKNWFMLFIFSYIILMILFILKANDISFGELFMHLVTLPLKTSLLICLLGGMIPVFAGLIIDTPYALIAKHIKTGKKADISEYYHIVTHEEERFDLSMQHVSFFAICNLTGAITTATVILFVKRIPNFDTYISKSSMNTPLFIITFAAIFVALYNNYMLQTKYVPIRNNHNYILTRAHAFFNFFWLTFSISVSCGLLFAFLLFRISSSYATPDSLDSSFLIMILAAYSYLWFSADSPLAKDIDSISKDNFVSGAPVLAFFSILYTILCFDMSMTCILSFVVNILVLAVWYIVVKKRKNIGVIRFITSFFSVIAVFVILMLVLNL